MAITKLRLAQIHDESGDFEKVDIPANHLVPDTLHDMLANLQKTMELRFGSDAIHADGIYQAADMGVVASLASGQAADLVIKHVDAGQKIEIDSAQHVEVKAAAQLTGSAADMLLSASAKLDLSSNGFVNKSDAKIEEYADSSIEMYAKANSLWQINSAEVKLETLTTGNVVFESAQGIDGNAAGAVTFDAGNAISLDAAALSNFTTTAGNLVLEATDGSANVEINGGAAIDMNSVLLDVDMTGAVQIDSAANSYFKVDADMELSASGAMNQYSLGTYTGTFEAGFAIAGLAASDIQAGGQLDVAGTSLELSASSTHIRFDDFYRTDDQGAGALTGYADGIKLAGSFAEWSAFEASFGEVSLLKAITDAALGGTSDAADYVLTATGTVSSGAKLSTVSASFSAVKIDDANGSAAYTPAAIDCSGFTANEALRNVAIYVNGQKLISGADYSLNYLSETIDPQFTFDLEVDDVVVIEVG